MWTGKFAQDLRTTALVLILSLAFLTAIPAPIIRVSALHQNILHPWSLFGPWQDSVVINFASEPPNMLTLFQQGVFDITDSPVPPGDFDAICGNLPSAKDNFCTDPEGGFGIFQLDFNHHNSFLGVPFQRSRVVLPAVAISQTDAPGTCPMGTNRLIVTLQNAETGNSLINDTLSSLTATHAVAKSPRATVGENPAGRTYTFPCLLAGPYTLTSSIYAGAANTTAPSTTQRDIFVTLALHYNSVSNAQPTQEGIEFRRAIAHLMDKPSFQNVPDLVGTSVYDDIPAPPAQGVTPCTGTEGGPTDCAATFSHLPQSVLNADCSAHSWLSGCNVVSAYNLVADAIGCQDLWWGTFGCGVANAKTGYPGVTDLRAACDHFVAAGMILSGGTCLDLATLAAPCTTTGRCTAVEPLCATTVPYSCAHLKTNGEQLIMYGRSSFARRPITQVFADSLQLLFGTPNGQDSNLAVDSSKCVVNYGYLSPDTVDHCTPKYYTISQISNVVFSIANTPPGNGVDDWNFYTAGHFLGATPDHLWILYNSQFSGHICGGAAEGAPPDYPLWCLPQYDGDTSAGEFAVDLTHAAGFFGRASIEANNDVMTIPIYSLQQQFAALNSWSFFPAPQSSLVPVLGRGFLPGFWSLLNMRCNPGNNAFASTTQKKCGGGTSGLIRRGFSQDTFSLSVFSALSPWELEIIGLVYDSLLVVTPRTGGANSQVIDWMTKNHRSSFSSNELSCVPQASGPPVCVSGTTTQEWSLRNDIKFHNGAAVTADDVCFDILTLRDVPSSNFAPSVAPVATCTIINPTTVQVKLQNQSPFYELNIGSVPIFPASPWQGPCSWVASKHDSSTEPSVATMEASACSSISFDPMATAMFLGSGAWVCKSSGGVAGGPCTSSGTSLASLSDTIRLSRNEHYVRCCPNLQGTGLQAVSWADRNDDGVVNILDIADAALHFNSYDAYWAHPLFSAIPANNKVDIGDIATIAFNFDTGITKPFSPFALLMTDMYGQVVAGRNIGLDPFEGSLDPIGGTSFGPFLQGKLSGGAITVTFADTNGVLAGVSGMLKNPAGTSVGTASGNSASGRTTFTYAGTFGAGRYTFEMGSGVNTYDWSFDT